MWIITQYRKRGDEDLVAEYPLSRPKIAILRELFANHDDESVVLSYPVTAPEQRRYVEDLIGKKIDRARYDYFLESYARSPIRQRSSANGARPRVRSSQR